MTKHSNTIGGSTAGRVLACPASYELCKKMPQEPESPYAAEGTALHQAMEYALREGYESGAGDSQQLVGQEFYGCTLTQEQIDEGIEPAIRQFDEIYAEYDADPGGVEFVLEKRIQFPGIPDAFGTADVILYTAQRAAILDWKFGAGVIVTAEENSQMLYYGMAALSTMDETLVRDDALWADWPVELVIVQPRVSEDAASRWTVAGKRLLSFKADLISAYKEATSPKPSYARGEHCRWCTAQPICPLYKDIAQNLQTLVEEQETPTFELPESFTPDDLAAWLHTAGIVESWVKAVNALVMKEAEAGRPPTGKKLVARLANTSWVSDDTAAIDRMLARLDLNLTERRQPWKNVSPTQAIKALKKKGKKLKESATQRLPGKPVLVDEADERPALLSNDEKAAGAGAALIEMQGASPE